jgi:hypothetical protein
MEYLGISKDHGAIYEGGSIDRLRVWPPPALAPIRFMQGKVHASLVTTLDGLATMIFREDDFDPVTKIRRGRVFTLEGGGQPREWQVNDPHLSTLPKTTWGHGMAQTIRLVTYQRSPLADLARLPSHLLPAVALGADPHITYWRIVNLECNVVGSPVLTLKAKHSLGDTPELLEDKVPAEVLAPLREALESVEASANRLAPVDVIDRCRSALSIVFGHQAGDRSKDLGKAIEAYLQTQDSPKENLCSSCGRIVARLHSRGKPNEQARRGHRSPTESDADLALNCLKTVLVDFGWAR